MYTTTLITVINLAIAEISKKHKIKIFSCKTNCMYNYHNFYRISSLSEILLVQQTRQGYTHVTNLQWAFNQVRTHSINTFSMWVFTRKTSWILGGF